MNSLELLQRINRRLVARVTFALVSTALLSGCSSNNKPASAPASRETLNMIREQMAAADPNAMVGLVSEVEKSGKPFAAVTDLPTKDFHEGEPLTFIDSNRQYLTNGIVRRITDDTLHVEWVKPGPDGRAPRAGDLAIRFKPSP